jgi:Flp pilus assembly protein TadG
MIPYFKRLWRDRRGNALMIAGAAMPLLIGSVGLATDTIQWSLWNRQLQRAADSAAFAGAYARFQEKSSSDAVTRDLTNNNHLWVPLNGGYPQVSEPADTATFVRAVEVSLQVQQALTFSSMFLSTVPTITVTARAAAIDSGEFCVVALEDTNTSGIIIQGSTIVNLGCGMISNSPSASVSVGVNGTSHNVTADPVAGAGGVPDINGVTNEQSYHLAQPDPYENLYDMNVPAGVSCTGKNSPTKQVTPTAAEAADGITEVLNPGCYTGNNQFKFTGGKTKLKPGTYYLNGSDFETQGTANITGTGVTIILTGSTPGQVKLSGTGVINLTAPTTGPFAKMLLMQSPSASNSDGNIINGNNGSSFDGAIYFPNQGFEFTGSSAAATKCAMVVARRVSFSGNSNFQNNTTGCVAPTKVKGKIIKLIA